jgi:hypothetical protein
MLIGVIVGLWIAASIAIALTLGRAVRIADAARQEDGSGVGTPADSALSMWEAVPLGARD